MGQEQVVAFFSENNIDGKTMTQKYSHKSLIEACASYVGSSSQQIMDRYKSSNEDLQVYVAEVISKLRFCSCGSLLELAKNVGLLPLERISKAQVEEKKMGMEVEPEKLAARARRKFLLQRARIDGFNAGKEVLRQQKQRKARHELEQQAQDKALNEM